MISNKIINWERIKSKHFQTAVFYTSRMFSILKSIFLLLSYVSFIVTSGTLERLLRFPNLTRKETVDLRDSIAVSSSLHQSSHTAL